MPDISMCSNNACPLRENCRRYNSIPNEFMQSYADFKFVVEDGEVKCDYYWHSPKKEKK